MQVSEFAFCSRCGALLVERKVGVQYMPTTGKPWGMMMQAECPKRLGISGGLRKMFLDGFEHDERRWTIAISEGK